MWVILAHIRYVMQIETLRKCILFNPFPENGNKLKTDWQGPEGVTCFFSYGEQTTMEFSIYSVMGLLLWEAVLFNSVEKINAYMCKVHIEKVRELYWKECMQAKVYRA